MRALKQIRKVVENRRWAYVLAHKDAVKLGHKELSESLYELTAEDDSILCEIDKIMAAAAKRRVEIRDTIFMAILGAGVAIVTAILW